MEDVLHAEMGGISMTYEELNMEYWGRVVPMVRDYNARHNTGLKPADCIRYFDSGEPVYRSHFVFDDPNPDAYKFAVAILEGKPVFIGDTVCHKQSGIERIISAGDLVDDFEDNFTWKQPKPKRTFTLNGVELPCPMCHSVMAHPLDISGRVFYFKSPQDRNYVFNAILNVLIEARNKQ